MELFNRKPNKKASVSDASSRTMGIRSSRAHVLRQARITEKATIQAEGGVYVFDVATNATKRDILMAIRDLYNVVPRKIAIAQVPSKKKRSPRTGHIGIKQGGKKAYVYLKAGETISIS